VTEKEIVQKKKNDMEEGKKMKKESEKKIEIE